jgi:hypothetical protein
MVYTFGFRIKYGFFPPARFTDLSGYECVLDFCIQHKIHLVAGDVVEIGVFLGGGTYKLSRYFHRHSPDKKIYAVDMFDIDFDTIVCTQGHQMRDLYRRYLNTFNIGNLRQAFDHVTKSCHNIEVKAEDSKNVDLPCDKVCLGYIDGNHSAEYVENDFYVIWNKLSSGGAILFDDYGFDIREATDTIHGILGKEKKTILRVYTIGIKTLAILKR